MKKFPWFKVWNDDVTHQPALQALWDEHKLEAVAVYYKLCQIMSRYESHDARGKARVAMATLSKETSCNIPKLSRLLSEISLKTLGSFENVSGGFLEFTLANWAKSQEIRERKTIDKPVINRSRREKREERRENTDKEVKSYGTSVPLEVATLLQPMGKALLAKVKQQASIDTWLSTYEPTFIAKQINEAAQWLTDNSEERPNAAGFLSGWFKRSKETNKFKTNTVVRKRVDSMDHDDGYVDPILGRR